MKINLFLFTQILLVYASPKSKKSPRYNCLDDDYQIRSRSGGLLTSCSNLLHYYPNGCSEDCCDNIPIYYLTSNYCRQTCNFCNSIDPLNISSTTSTTSSTSTVSSTTSTISSTISTTSSITSTTSLTTLITTRTSTESFTLTPTQITTLNITLNNDIESNTKNNSQNNQSYYFLIGVFTPIIIILLVYYLRRKRKNNLILTNETIHNYDNRGFVNGNYDVEYAEINETYEQPIPQYEIPVTNVIPLDVNYELSN